MNPVLMIKILAVVAAVVIIVFFVGKDVEKAKWQAREIELNQMAVEAKIEADKRANEIATAYEVLKNTKQVAKNDISRSITNEIAKNRSQYDCPVPDAGRLLISASVTNANGDSPAKPSGELPKN